MTQRPKPEYGWQSWADASDPDLDNALSVRAWQLVWVAAQVVVLNAVLFGGPVTWLRALVCLPLSVCLFFAERTVALVLASQHYYERWHKRRYNRALSVTKNESRQHEHG